MNNLTQPRVCVRCGREELPSQRFLPVGPHMSMDIEYPCACTEECRRAAELELIATAAWRAADEVCNLWWIAAEVRTQKRSAVADIIRRHMGVR